MSSLYTLLIYPLELLFEVVFTIAHRIVGNPGWAIIVLSLIVNFLVLPLYNRADAVQKQERDIEETLAPGVERIKKAFKGDEKMMMLQAYYKENNYSPVFVLKSSVSLLLQVPFFIAAYQFLSNLALLKGVSFGPIKDLGAPDGLLVLSGLSINLLPVIMTLINVISGVIYTKGMPLKSKIQLYGMALLFLVVLYNSPSGLAFYWTLNNLFSLVKNVFYKLKKPGFVFSVLIAVIGALGAVYINTIYYTPYTSRRMRLTAIFIAFIIPLAVTLIRSRSKASFGFIEKLEYSKTDRNLFLSSGLFLSVLSGLLIPSSVVKISPNEFMNLMNLKNPIIYIIHAFLIAAGFFVIWGGVFFALANKKIRVIISRIWLVMCPSALVTYMFFGKGLGDISINFVYFLPFRLTLSQKLINLAVIVVAVAVFLILNRKLPKICTEIVFVFALATVAVSVINMIPVNQAYRKNLNLAQMSMPRIPLSTEGNNVMVIMLDRAPGYLVPIIFDELPQLYDMYDGFTYYPNTLSYGNRTKFAALSLFGGYDYTPEAVNADTTRDIRTKTNESLLVMPILFRDEGYEVTLLDPPNANCETPSDLSIFDVPEYEGINAYYDKFQTSEAYYVFEDYQEGIWNRNFFCYSIFRMTPLFFQDTVYNEGLYNRPDDSGSYEVEYTIPQFGFSESSSGGVDRDGIAAYDALCGLADITDINNNPEGTFMYYDNDTAHDAMLYQAPDYVPYQYVDNIQYDIDHLDRFAEPINGYYLDMTSYETMRNYSSNAAAYLRLGEYFEYLREQGVWDNTRIIIVADHGIAHGDALMFGDQLTMRGVCFDSFNPILMVKDFGSTGFNISEEFMTNADVPYLATYGLIDNPVNSFTGNPIRMDHTMPIHVLDSNDWTRAGGDALRFAEDDWYAFNGTEVIDMNAWEFDGTR